MVKIFGEARKTETIKRIEINRIRKIKETTETTETIEFKEQ